MNLNTLIEYAKLVPKFIDNHEQIVEGFKNEVKSTLGKLDEAEEEEIIRRRLICAACPFQSENAKDKGYVTDRMDAHCTLCLCNINVKTSCLSCKCGAHPYNLNNPDDTKEVKWHEFPLQETKESTTV